MLLWILDRLGSGSAALHVKIQCTKWQHVQSSLTNLKDPPACMASSLREAQYYVSVAPERPGRNLQRLLDGLELPCWVPHRCLADALGFSHGGIAAAEGALGRGYLWASEFENVHSLWPFREPGFTAHGVRFAGPEQFYQLHKHRDARLWPAETTPSFAEAIGRAANVSEMEAYGWGQRCSVRDDWETAKVEVMRVAVAHKFRADPGLRALLLSTAPHPLASVKGDAFWGIGFDGEGENMLAKLLMQLRDTLMAEDSEVDLEPKH
ncbi:unnamed protein product, partial [Effrenium voratum]